MTLPINSGKWSAVHVIVAETRSGWAWNAWLADADGNAGTGAFGRGLPTRGDAVLAFRLWLLDVIVPVDADLGVGVKA